MDRLGLSLLVGPANAGKVALLLERYLAAAAREPFLIVPNRSDVDRVERDLLRRQPSLLGGSIGTFDDLFRLVAGDEARILSDAQRALVLRRVVGDAALNGLSRSARFAGFADELARTLAELEAGLVDPGQLPGDLASLHLAYRVEVERLASEFESWHGAPVFAYGFEDLTGAEWELLRALAGRTDVTVSIPYEPGRAAFESLRGTVTDLSALAAGSLEELQPRYHEYAQPALAHVERFLFEDAAPASPPIDGAIRFLEGAGTRGTLELVAEEVLRLVRAGAEPEQIAIVCPSIDRWRAPLETALATLGVPIAIEGPTRLQQTPFGRALLSLLRFVWLGGDRRDLFGFLRTPYSGVARGKVDFLEGRLRGRAINRNDRVDAETLALQGHPFPVVRDLREAATPVAGLCAVASSMLRNAHAMHRPAADGENRADLRAYEAIAELADGLDEWLSFAGATLTTREIVEALERAQVRGPGAREPGRVAVLDLMRARTRSFEFVLLLGLEEGVLPRRNQTSALLDDEARRELREARLVKPDQVARDRYLFYTACTRATSRIYLVREAATDEGAPRQPSPFWDEVVRLFPAEEVARATTRRSLSALTWPLHEAPTERERLRALARMAADDRVEAQALATANAWERRLARALTAFERETRLRHPLVLEQLAARTTFNVTELERFSDCSSAWFVERLLDPKTIDAEMDAKLRLLPNKFELTFGGERSSLRGLDLGNGLTLSGKIDRVDVETFGARGIVQDYKSGRKAHSASEIAQEQRLQIPLYMLVLRDLVGIEPLGGLYRPLAGERKPRGLLRSSAKDELPGYTRTDYLEDA